MVQIVASPEAGPLVSTFRDQYVKAFRWMLLARVLDDKLASLYRAGKILGGVFLGRGQEALSVSIGVALREGDVFAPLMRGIQGTVGVACCGDGSTSTGSFHEAMNQAAVEKLPLVMVVADNQYAYSTPNTRQFACASLADKADGYGVDGHSVDGTDLGACLRVMKEAVVRARAGRGPQMVFARLLRLCGHGEHDDAQYIDPKLKQSPLGRDCLKVAEEHLLRQGWADARTLERWRTEVTQQIEEAVGTVQREPTPDPYKENWRALSSPHFLEAGEEPAG